MPAIITHDLFGHDVYHDLYRTIGGSRQEADAFLLGSQGPDPLFFSVLSPHLRSAHDLGSRMHHEKAGEVIAAFKESLGVLTEAELAVGRAYALGFLCHYLLDSTMHPFVHYQEYLICDAGEPGLDRSAGSEVHGVIETEFDEIMLFSKREETIATFAPARQTLRADGATLRVISKMYVYVALTVYGMVIPSRTFADSVCDYRFALSVMHSRTGRKRRVMSRLERLFKEHSLCEALTHRPVERTQCDFDNRERASWENPFTGEISSDGFWDRLDVARSRVDDAFALFDEADFDASKAFIITDDKDFSGRPMGAVLVSVADMDGVENNA